MVRFRLPFGKPPARRAPPRPLLLCSPKRGIPLLIIIVHIPLTERQQAVMALSNASFRDLLAKKEEEQQSKPQRADTQEERQRKKAKAQAAYERRMAIQKRREEALAEASRYTDRAAERRKEETKESRENGRQPEPFNDMEEEEDADAVVSSAPTFAQLGDREDLAQQQHRVSIAQSKYLGGDIEHTHLVKGLDFALLQKMRSELSGTKTKEMEGNAKKESMSTQVNEIASGKGKARKLSAPSSGSNAAKASTSIKPTKPTKLAFATELGRDVHRSIFGTNSRPNKALAEVRLASLSLPSPPHRERMCSWR